MVGIMAIAAQGCHNWIKPGGRMTYTNQLEPETSEKGMATRGVHLGGQIFGLLIAIVGAYFAILILGACIAVIRDPGQSAGSIATMTKTIGLEAAEVTSGKNQIPIGKVCAGVLLLVWYQVAAWISLRLIVVGAQMISSGRKELIAAMREFDILRRSQR
jgi:hypothetical protein